MSSIRRHSVAAVVFLSLLAPSLASGQATISQWQRWETTITAARNYTGGSGQAQGNPYRDLTLRVRFTHSPSGDTFVQDAYWTGNPTGDTQFKVRSKLYPGTWTWKVESCAGISGGFNCATDPNLTPTAATGTIGVWTNTSTGKKLYDRGTLMQLQYVTGAGTSGYSQLLYHDLSDFYWAGDTAWVAPPREISGQSPNAWDAYLADRKQKGFTVVLVAPAPAWTGGPGWAALPNPVSPPFSFEQATGCSSPDPIPNVCSRPRPAYWNAFDVLVQKANQQDLVVGVVGVVDPVGLGSNGTFPNKAYGEDFARYLAARLGGNHVVFSPAFDIWATDVAKDGTSMQTVMNAVGNALKASAPRHLVTNHLAGQSPCEHYQWFKSSGWMSFYLFQSGHASGNGGNNGTCPGKLPGETAQRAALRRAREMPLTLRGYSSPSKPSYNGEALYDGHPTPAEPNTRYRVRQSGYTSVLSGALGFTYGTSRLWQWSEITTQQQQDAVFDLGSAFDMQRLIARFKDLDLFPRHDLILNQTADPNHENKMVLASNSYSLLIAYLPGGASSIKIATAGFGNLTCANALWSKKWYNPQLSTANTQAIVCTQGTGWIQLNRPTSGGNGSNDWVLELFNGSISTLVAAPVAAQAPALAVWSEPTTSDGGTAILAELAGGEPFVVSVEGGAIQAVPQVGTLSDGRLVAWHAEGLDGSLLGVFAQRLDAAGRPVGDRFQVNGESEGDQRDPVIATDGLGEALVAWSSYRADEGRGRVMAQRFDGRGWPRGGEMLLAEAEIGRLESPLVGFAEDGGFVVAWTEPGLGGTAPAVAFRHFDAAGRPRGEVVRREGRPEAPMRAVAVESSAGFDTLRYVTEDSFGRTVVRIERFDASGRPAAPPLRLDLGGGPS